MIKDFVEYIKSDLTRYYGKDDLYTFIKAIFKNPSFRFQCVFRLANSKSNMCNVVSKILYKVNKTRKSIQLPIGTQVGYGLYIGHGGPIVINGTAIIGDNCNLSQFTTIGSNNNKAAIIGDNVYIGPNVCIVEDVVIGSNVTIGAGSIVVKNIPNDATAVGNYAKVVYYKNAGKYIHNKWYKR